MGKKIEKIQTGFRVDEILNDEIEETSKLYGITKNALMTIAIRIGLNSLNGISLNLVQAE